MLLQNLWNEHGLTNGVNGIVKYIVYKEGITPPKLPSFVLVYFPQYTGPSFHPTEEQLVPIVPILRNWYESKSEHPSMQSPYTKVKDRLLIKSLSILEIMNLLLVLHTLH